MKLSGLFKKGDEKKSIRDNGKMEFRFCFAPKSLSIIDVLEIIDQSGDFLPLTISISDTRHHVDQQSIFLHPEFRAGFCFNSEDYIVQNTTSVFDYEVRELRPDKIYKNFGDKKVDIQNNPGRSEVTSLTWLVSSWRMWFGRSFYEMVGKEKLQRFNSADIVKELAEEVTFIQLYDNPQDYNKAENRKKQQAFRDHIDFAGLVLKYPRYR
ncbi:MAG: hypothetical protein J7578_03390 [Chitinophagaceae bacterium]|nr:hypothetical protein [Chitinophagaceae bacterium]